MTYSRAPKCTGADEEELFSEWGSNFYVAFTRTFKMRIRFASNANRIR